MELSLNLIKIVQTGVFFFMSVFLYSQEINYKNFNVQNGLTSNEVYDILQDDEKNIWIATARGVVKYNGEVFTQYTTREGIGGNVVFYLIQDQQNRIWFLASNGNLTYYFQSRIYPYRFNHVIKKHFKEGAIIRSLIADDDLYLGTLGEGMCKIDKSGNLYDMQDTSIINRTFYVEEIRSKYLLSIDNTSSKISRGRGENIFSLKEGNKSFVANLGQKKGMQNLFFIKRKNGDMLFAVYNDMLIIRNNFILKKFTYQHDIISMYEDKDSNVWIGSKAMGVKKFSGKKGFDEDNFDEIHFSNLSISKTLQDKDGNYWFASLENGIFYIPEINLKTIVHNTDIKAPFYITAIGTHQKQFFVGTNTGAIFNYYSGKLIQNELYVPKQLNYINGFYSINQELFVSGSKCGFYLTGNQINKKFLGNVIACCAGKDGNIYSCNRNAIKISPSLDSTFIKNSVTRRFETILQDSGGTIWLGSNTGLFLIRNDSIVPAPISFYNRLHVTDIKESKGKLYIATLGNGILVLSHQSFSCYNKKMGMLSEMVNKIIIEDDKYIWAATTKGVHKININTGNVETIIDSHKGLPSDEIKMIALQNDTLYIANYSFISFFNTKILQPNTEDPEIVLENIRLNEQTWKTGDGTDFNYNENNIEFTIHSHLYRQLGDIEYKYRLIGLDDNYTHATNNVIRFNFLPPGNYTFEAYALNEDRKESSKPIFFHFTIRQAYWKTFWFYGIVFFTSTLIIALIIYTYFRRKNKKRNLQLQLLESKQQAFTNQMNPHFIFNALNSVQTYILAENKAEALNYLGKFSKLMRQTLTNTREMLVSLSSEADLISHYLQLEQSRYSGIRYLIDDDLVASKNPVLVPSMLIQPFIENSIKHGILKKFNKEGLILIQFFMKENWLYCVIEDDGVGLNEAREMKNKYDEHSSAGIEITLDRLKLYCKTYKTPYHFEIVDISETDANRSGTRVEFIIPYTLKNETNSNHHR